MVALDEEISRHTGPCLSGTKSAAGLNLMPPELAEFIAANTDAIASVLDTPIRKA